MPTSCRNKKVLQLPIKASFADKILFMGGMTSLTCPLGLTFQEIVISIVAEAI